MGNQCCRCGKYQSQTGYLGQNSLNVEFGLGNASVIDSLFVRWTTGMEEIFTNVPVNQFLTITENQPPVVSHTPTLSTAVGNAIEVQALVTDALGIADVSLNYRRGGDAQFTSILMTESTGSLYNATIPAGAVTSRGLEYFISVTDLGGLNVRLPAIGFFHVTVDISEPGIDRGDPQAAGSEQTAFRLFSMPLDLVNKDPSKVLDDDLGSYDIIQWRFFEVIADQSKVEFPNTSAIAPGKGFWLIVREVGRTIDTGAGRSISTAQDYAIPLHSQWNLIGNPFNFPIPVSNLSLSKGQPVELRTYIGSWNDPVNNPVTTIQPFKGYALFNSSGSNTTLSVNPDLSSGSTTVARESSSQTSWSLQIKGQSQAAVDEDNFLGSSSVASNDWDKLDRPEPPVIGEFISLYFPHPEWGELSKNYCTDFRPKISDGEIWEFEVKTNIRDVVNLTFEGINDVPNEYEVWLLDPILQTSQDLRRNESYSVAASVEHPKRLQLLIGNPDFVNEKLAASTNIPRTFELYQNFPNPFNPTTTIRYGLPREERVTLRIYNILGEEVVTLVNDEVKRPGFHATLWDGRNDVGRRASSGVYFVQMRASNFVQTRKMILIQ